MINIWINRLTKIYLVFFMGVIIIYVMSVKPRPVGEWDDYSMVTASILNDGNVTVTKDDLIAAKKIFPEWSEFIDESSLSGFYARQGGEMSWYFPTYSAACVPIALILRMSNVPVIYAFALTNVVALVGLLWYVFWRYNVNCFLKLITILLLSVNPILTYVTWISAEVFIYAILAIGVLNWIHERYKLAALFVSIAATLNPTILFVGIVMITSYLWGIIKEYSWSVAGIKRCFCENWKRIFVFGLCFIPGIIPFVYNYYNTGSINLTAAVPTFIISETKTWERCLAYLFDLNLGIAPFFSIILFSVMIMVIATIIKKKYIFIKLFLSFIGTIYMFSIMIHINSGMTIIARYNAWVVVILIFAFTYFWESEEKQGVKVFGYAVAMISVMISGVVMYQCRGCNERQMNPIAEWFLNKYPSVYNPLPSTFYSRIANVDGGYSYNENLPVYYENKDGEIRKILLSESEKTKVMNEVVGSKDAIDWFEKKIEKLNSSAGYVSVDKKHQLFRFPSYDMGTEILFTPEEIIEGAYIMEGISPATEVFGWTVGEMATLKMKFKEYNKYSKVDGMMSIEAVHGSRQQILLRINEQLVGEYEITGKSNIYFEFLMPGNGAAVIEILCPDAYSPKELGESDDARELAIGIKKIVMIGI